MPALMVQGCTSWAGKSWLVTALCRWLSRQGVAVAPFKAQNMSNNARVLDRGGEIGVAQWLQARAARVAPDVRMNPVLIKPERDGSQVVRLGVADESLSSIPWLDRGDQLWPTARDALDDLLVEFDLVLIEGAGSPAEINLADSDIANMRVAAHADASVLLTVDIDRGGAFAHLYGTWKLVGEEYQRRIQGFILNRFRGDPALLSPGPHQLEVLTGVPTLGVIPMIDHDLPDEDGASLHRAPQRSGLARVCVVRYPFASNLDEFTTLEQVADVRWATSARHLDSADMIVLPGSKHVTADLGWLHNTGLADAVVERAGRTPVLGICGGLQMLGAELLDESGREGSARGLGLLPVVTTFGRVKRTSPVRVRFRPELGSPWNPLARLTVEGYEIRHGVTSAGPALPEALPEGRGWAHGNVLGVYVHGILENPEVLGALFNATPDRTLDATIDRLADAVEQHLDTTRLRHLTRI